MYLWLSSKNVQNRDDTRSCFLPPASTSVSVFTLPTVAGSKYHKKQLCFAFGGGLLPPDLADDVVESAGPRGGRTRNSSCPSDELEQRSAYPHPVSTTFHLTVSQCPVGSRKKFGTLHRTDGLSERWCSWQMPLPSDLFSFRTSPGFLDKLEKACVNPSSKTLP